ncbi:plexin-C1 isoform X2 [Brienomyrus brachyistius]|uniref:plexin-C1 isoform X2 n=1 Tax=Brienomyrus brachyistius TaxID=42636 RepID=UPI0020B3B7BD|nr:plexin-C1 isoform X2 [Brienomyrus brachyistius]
MTPFNYNASSLCFLVELESGAYLMTGVVETNENVGNCLTHINNAITLRNTMHGQDGEIFSEIASGLTPKYDLKASINFVDGFQLGPAIYIFVNVQSDKKVQLLRLRRKGDKSDVLQSTKKKTLSCCDEKPRWKLVSSSYIGGDFPGYWAGVFTAGNTSDQNNTALAIYNITKNPQDDLKPEAVAFTHPSMTSVAAVSNASWVVLFVGTADGQLIKIALDGNLKPTCARVLYESDEDVPVFFKMLLDPENTAIYMATGKQLTAVSVAQCDKYSSMKDCWSAQDPFCGWCVPKKRCMFNSECPGTTVEVYRTMPSLQIKSVSSDQITVNVTTPLRLPNGSSVSCSFNAVGSDICYKPTSPCSCTFPVHNLPAEGFNIAVRITVAEEEITEHLVVKNCPNITAASSVAQCYACVTSGCTWSSSQTCSWPNGELHEAQAEDVCKDVAPPSNYSKPEVHSVIPNVVSFHGKNNAEMTGTNLDLVTKIRLQGSLECYSEELQVLAQTAHSLRFNLPSWKTDMMTVCALLPDGRCVGSKTVTYRPLPHCTAISPSNTWASGGRKVTISGEKLDLVDGIELCGKVHFGNPSSKSFEFHSPPNMECGKLQGELIRLCLANETRECVQLTYLPNPEFTSFKATSVGSDLRIVIAKKSDKLYLVVQELIITAKVEDKQHQCNVEMIVLGNGTAEDSVMCRIINQANARVQSVRIVVGNFSKQLEEQTTNKYYWIVLVLIAFVALMITGVLLWVYHFKKKKLAAEMDKYLDTLECEIRNEIRQGFVDMQITEASHFVENVATIPFLDYKHFALRIFFPEAESMSNYMKDFDQSPVRTQPTQSCLAFSQLIRNKIFLTSFIHALEAQRNFTVKDKCTVASLLTLALHTDLPYLTEVMQDLLRALMDQSSNVQPKLLLRRTESIVEKLLTNWMSVCLYGFLRESVGQPLYLLVSALVEKTLKGPVDCVTGKALYTLNEDWLLWLAEDFHTLKLKVSFSVGSGEESECLEVSALDCDTVEQVKEKILAAFKSKFGFPYYKQLEEIDIYHEKDGSTVLLLEVDSTSKVVGEATLLNTLKHYKVPDDALIKVTTMTNRTPLTTQVSLKGDQNFTTKYCHLIDPDIDTSQRKNPERKKLKLKEINLTKLLSTKVAVHSFLENLFRTIWGMANKVSPAIKFFFDFLDSEVERKKITDPDVPHIWKTNSLPLRFWVNILKNPQFVFDIDKTPLLDGCLSVIAQTFMDSFSLLDQQLGKNAPTNKLLYVKDIPQYKQEVKTFYKLVKDLPQITEQEFREFLNETAKKHENEFNESAALRDLYKYVKRYFREIQDYLEQNNTPSDLQVQLEEVRNQFENMSNLSWE